ncbi:gephyrin-like molybdotransferase Glp [Antrihabitans sp. YC2-6]|uniref:molybdopterin molybdotransferase MoeA n=1 Tax=Antrihabitans sp. YC2-6 TaxID=2799498 RepID=UPI0018F2F17F|nr:gephyrin-like molybdotransferase Glp [Antrihabitans sp. YC2-6]MBJ8343496.1 molybdopterin molybdotransferase MoeA [Antrihabitans sp. YC2-6]
MTRRTVAEYASHITRLLRPLEQLPTEDVPLRSAIGRLLAADVTSPLDLPLFRNSQMDGFAVDAASVVEVPARLTVRATIAAGDAGLGAHVPGTATRIMTGAPMPPGADCVVPVEDTAADGDTVVIRRGRVAGEFVREPGTDVGAGSLLLPAGALLAPRHIAVFAAVGIQTVTVRRRVRAAVITTGTELIPAGNTLGPGQIYDSNGIALATSLEANGVEVVSVGHSSDDPAEFRKLLDAATESADLVVTSGGVSMGDFEVVKDVLVPLGGEFGHVAMQPGGPQGSTVVDGIPVLSFPGNPVSTLVSFEVFARPILRRCAGLPPIVAEELVLSHPVTSVAKRQFLRGRRLGDKVEVVSGPGSHLIAAMAWADVLIDIPAEVLSVDAGSEVKVWAL